MKIISKSIILKKKTVNENNIICSILSEDIGYIDALAFGANSLSKRFKGNLDYFKILKLELISKNNTDFYNISSSCRIIYDFKNISKNLSKFYIASYVLELSSIIIHHKEIYSKNNKNYFDIIYNTLNYINEHNSINKEFALKFTLKIFKETGFIPEDYKLKINTNLKKFIANTIPYVPKSVKYL